MRAYIAGRLATAVLVILGVSVVSFFLTFLTGDPAEMAGAVHKHAVSAIGRGHLAQRGFSFAAELAGTARWVDREGDVISGADVGDAVADGIRPCLLG